MKISISYEKGYEWRILLSGGYKKFASQILSSKLLYEYSPGLAMYYGFLQQFSSFFFMERRKNSPKEKMEEVKEGFVSTKNKFKYFKKLRGKSYKKTLLNDQLSLTENLRP